uniref:arginine kinase n=1 Tax=Acrobeloides nanus TaxID=290746 RepID=A0A914BY08_9BILA
MSGLKRLLNSPFFITAKLILKETLPGLVGGKTWIWLDPRKDRQILVKIQEAYEKLQSSPECNSLLKKHLTQSLLKEISHKSTKYGGTLYHVIRSGVKNLDSHIGVSASDPDAYMVFSELYDKIIYDLHGYKPDQTHPKSYFGDHEIYDKTNTRQSLPPLDPENKYIKSTRIRCARMLKGYPFNSLMTESHYMDIENKLKERIRSMQEDWFHSNSEMMKNPDMVEILDGDYYHLSNMQLEVYEQLVKDRIIFRDDCRFLKASNGIRFWPNGRGVYFNRAENFLIWVNEEDHLRFISMERGSDVAKVYHRLATGVKEISQGLSYVWDDHLGWLTYGPANLGSTIRASVIVKLPNLSKKNDFSTICNSLNLQIREVGIEDQTRIYDISNRQRLGLTELEAVRQMYDGVKELISMEDNKIRSVLPN